MRKISIIVLALLVLGASAGFAQDKESLFGEWKGKVAAPTYGFAALPISVVGADGGAEEELWVPGLDLRIFMGTNVTKRAGFFYGLEVGTLVFFTPEEGTTINDSWNDVDYSVDMNYSAGMVFALAKYGYRIDLGISAMGVSLGAELGMGARIANGYLGLEMIDYGASNAYAERGWDAEGGTMDLILDGALEAALRLGRNFRLFARVGALVTPPFLNEKIGQEDWWNYKDGIPTASDEDDARTLVARYDVEIFPVIVTGRLGFALNY
jgi:hypothetical protein